MLGIRFYTDEELKAMTEARLEEVETIKKQDLAMLDYVEITDEEKAEATRLINEQLEKIQKLKRG